MKKNNIRTLVKLLEDDDVATSGHAMSELLSKPFGIQKLIKNLQESQDSSLRKRAHQLQVIVSSRIRRKNLAARMAEKNANLIKGLVELHLQWFDEDIEHQIIEDWDKFVIASSEWKADSAENIAEFMKNMEFSSGLFQDLRPDDYCLGEIVATRTGADFILCAIARFFARSSIWNPSIIATDAGFCLFDEKKKIGVFPAKEWMCAECEIRGNVKRWSDDMILALTANSMFLCALSMGSLRYSYMLASCISGSLNAKNPFKILPYPLGEAKQDNTLI